MNTFKEIESLMIAMRNDSESQHLMRFFKCGKGEYGEGDCFLGIRVPQTRKIVKEYRKIVTVKDVRQLVKSRWHEVRLCGFLLMIELYKKEVKDAEIKAEEIVSLYLESIQYANNWDLVDLSASYILGDWLVRNPEDKNILHILSGMEGEIWHQRVAMVSTWMLIRNGEFKDTFILAERYLTHKHDLIHKATGWMLREIGKRGGEKELREFLEIHATKMPRTMLRYAIEKFPQEERVYYMKKDRSQNA